MFIHQPDGKRDLPYFIDAVHTPPGRFQHLIQLHIHNAAFARCDSTAGPKGSGRRQTIDPDIGCGKVDRFIPGILHFQQQSPLPILIDHYTAGKQLHSLLCIEGFLRKVNHFVVISVHGCLACDGLLIMICFIVMPLKCRSAHWRRVEINAVIIGIFYIKTDFHICNFIDAIKHQGIIAEADDIVGNGSI